ncbi:MAG TPA: hypothetical protein PKO28_01865 [Bacilli bacterium]|nr:hypothetical protein [Bacilli bacterium]
MKKYYSVIRRNMMDFLMLKNYRHMPVFLAILTFIVMLPFIIPAFFIFGMLSVVYFFFYLIGLPAEFLLSFIKQESKDVQHATQAVIYFIGFPVIFFYYVYMSLSIFIIYIGYILFEVAVYYASLTAVPFKPDLVKAADENLGDPVYTPVEGKRFVAQPLVLVLVHTGLYFIGLTTLIILVVIAASANNLALATGGYIAFGVCAYLAWLFTLIYVPLAFRKKKVVAPAN